jgi:hypothetical protein
LTAFKSSDGGLAGTHPGGKLGLGDACSQTSLDQFGGNLELWSKRVILGLYHRVGQQTSLEFPERYCHATSFARRSASSISARGWLKVLDVRCAQAQKPSRADALSEPKKARLHVSR